MDLKHSYHETIGVLGDSLNLEEMTLLFKEEPTQFQKCQEIDNLTHWIHLHRPHLILIPASQISTLTGPGLSLLKEALKKMKTHSLVLGQSVDEFEAFRKIDWPMVHFYRGGVNAHLKQRIQNLISEQLLLHRPLVLILSDAPYFQSQVEMHLKNHGIRTRLVHSGKDFLQEIIFEKAAALIWDSSLWEERSKEIEEVLSKNPMAQLVVSDREAEGVSSIDALPEMVEQIRDKITSTKETFLWRDLKTGMYTPKILLDIASRELALAERFDDCFTVMKLELQDLEAIQSHYGPIFSHEFLLHLGLFIQNRVRHSDLVVCGKPGEVFILFSRVDRKIGTLIGERLRHSFKKLVTFEDSDNSSFSPELSYALYSYPENITSIKDIEAILKGQADRHPKSIKIAKS